MIRKLILAAALGLGLPGVAWADLVAGADAYKCDDFYTALREFRPLAEQGDAEAQYYLAIMYEYGDGLQKDYAEAAKWYGLAADQGETQAQYNLALLYADGEGVPQNLLLAYMWFDIAARRLSSYASKRDEVARQMAPLQIAEAQRMAQEWTPQGQMPTAAAALLLLKAGM